MSERRHSRLIAKYYLSRMLGHPGFFWPIYTLYMLSNGITYTQIGVIGTFQAVIVVGGELPTGYVGDRIGRRNSLVIGATLITISTAMYLVVETFWGFLALFVLLSFGNTFLSGSRDAWLYDILSERLDEERYTFVRGRGSAVGQWAMAVTMIAGSLLYVVDHTYPFVAGTVMGVVQVGVLLTFPKNAQYTDEGGDGETFTILDAMPIIRQKLTEPPLRSFVVYMALFYGAVMTADAYIQPIARNVLDANLDALLAQFGVPEAATLGFLYAGFTVVSAVASDFASNVEDALGTRGAILAIPLVTALVFLVPVFVPLFVFPMFFVMKGSGTLLRPITSNYLNSHTESIGRATVLSAVSMVYALARIPFALSSGYLADLWTPLLSVAALAAAFLVGGALVHLWEAPATDEHGRSAGASSD